MVVQSYQFKIANHTVKPIHSIVWPQVHALAGPTAGGGGAPVLAATPTVQEDVAGPPAPAPFPTPPLPPLTTRRQYPKSQTLAHNHLC